jgi:hypothetical protein
MGEFIQKAETAIAQLGPQMTRYRALETMDEKKYNPVAQLIDIADKLMNNADPLLNDSKLAVTIHLRLLEYFSAAPKKQMAIEMQGNPQIIVAPVSYGNLYAGKDLEPCKPRLIDIIPEKSALEEYMEGPDV